MSNIDKILSCCNCNSSFVFTGGEQDFFQAKGLTNEPKRCPNCRILVRVQRSGKDIATTAEVVCADCGLQTRVPFQPKGYRPVYCSTCLRTRKDELVAATV